MTEHTPETESESIALAALESSGAGWWRVLDIETAWWSPTMFDLFGLPRDSDVPTIGDLYRLYHPDDARMAASAFMKLFRSDEPVTLRYRVVHPSGEIRQHLTWGRRQPADADGNRWLVGMVMDVTEHVDDALLIEGERAFRFVADHTSDMVVRHRMGVGLTYVSPASRAVFGSSFVTGFAAQTFWPVQMAMVSSTVRKVRKGGMVSSGPSGGTMASSDP